MQEVKKRFFGYDERPLRVLSTHNGYGYLVYTIAVDRSRLRFRSFGKFEFGDFTVVRGYQELKNQNLEKATPETIRRAVESTHFFTEHNREGSDEELLRDYRELKHIVSALRYRQKELFVVDNYEKVRYFTNLIKTYEQYFKERYVGYMCFNQQDSYELVCPRVTCLPDAALIKERAVYDERKFLYAFDVKNFIAAMEFKKYQHVPANISQYMAVCNVDTTAGPKKYLAYGALKNQSYVEALRECVRPSE